MRDNIRHLLLGCDTPTAASTVATTAAVTFAPTATSWIRLCLVFLCLPLSSSAALVTPILQTQDEPAAAENSQSRDSTHNDLTSSHNGVASFHDIVTSSRNIVTSSRHILLLDNDFHQKQLSTARPSEPPIPSEFSGATGPTELPGSYGPSEPSRPSGHNGPSGPTGSYGPYGSSRPFDPSGSSGPSGAYGPSGPSEASGPSKLNSGRTAGVSGEAKLFQTTVAPYSIQSTFPGQPEVVEARRPSLSAAIESWPQNHTQGVSFFQTSIGARTPRPPAELGHLGLPVGPPGFPVSVPGQSTVSGDLPVTVASFPADHSTSQSLPTGLHSAGGLYPPTYPRVAGGPSGVRRFDATLHNELARAGETIWSGLGSPQELTRPHGFDSLQELSRPNGLGSPEEPSRPNQYWSFSESYGTTRPEAAAQSVDVSLARNSAHLSIAAQQSNVALRGNTAQQDNVTQHANMTHQGNAAQYVNTTKQGNKAQQGNVTQYGAVARNGNVVQRTGPGGSVVVENSERDVLLDDDLRLWSGSGSILDLNLDNNKTLYDLIINGTGASVIKVTDQHHGPLYVTNGAVDITDNHGAVDVTANHDAVDVTDNHGAVKGTGSHYAEEMFYSTGVLQDIDHLDGQDGLDVDQDIYSRVWGEDGHVRSTARGAVNPHLTPFDIHPPPWQPNHIPLDIPHPPRFSNHGGGAVSIDIQRLMRGNPSFSYRYSLPPSITSHYPASAFSSLASTTTPNPPLPSPQAPSYSSVTFGRINDDQTFPDSSSFSYFSSTPTGPNSSSSPSQDPIEFNVGVTSSSSSSSSSSSASSFPGSPVITSPFYSISTLPPIPYTSPSTSPNRNTIYSLYTTVSVNQNTDIRHLTNSSTNHSIVREPVNQSGRATSLVFNESRDASHRDVIGASARRQGDVDKESNNVTLAGVMTSRAGASGLCAECQKMALVSQSAAILWALLKTSLASGCC